MATKSMMKSQKTRTTGYVFVEKKPKVCVQGRHANIAGKALENFVEEALVNKGAYAVNHSKWVKGKIEVPAWARKVLFKQVAYTKPWGKRGYSDFVLTTLDRSIRIDTRYQSVVGSVEEKANFLFYVAERCYPEQEVILVLDGPGVRPEIRSWLIDMAKSVKHKSISIMTRNELTSWIGNNL